MADHSAISLVSGAGGGFSDGDHPLNCGLPTVAEGCRPGDMLFLMHYAASSAAGRSQAAISGWTNIFDDDAGGANGGYCSAWYRLFDPSIGATVSVPGTGFDGGSTSGDTTFVNAFCLRGVHPTSPIEELGAMVSGSQTDFGPFGAMDIAEGNAYLFFGGKDNTDGYTALTNQHSRTWTTVLSGSSTAGGNGSAFGQIGIGLPAVSVPALTIVTSGGALAMKARAFEIKRNPRRANLAMAML